jgi:hypothetical protein
LPYSVGTCSAGGVCPPSPLGYCLYFNMYILSSMLVRLGLAARLQARFSRTVMDLIRTAAMATMPRRTMGMGACMDRRRCSLFEASWRSDLMNSVERWFIRGALLPNMSVQCA